MKYMGSKNRFAKDLLPIILKDRKPEQWYVEPFAGGMNMIDKVDGNRIANDIHTELIEMWKALVYDKWEQPKRISKEVYNDARTNKTKYEPKLLGWIGFACSFSGDFFNGGCALDYPENRRRKDGTLPSYQQEAINSTNRQRTRLEGVKFFNKNYYDLEIPENSIIYCDPPYENTTKYVDRTGFNHILFWEWVRNKSKQGHKVYVSEYNAPSDFVCVWQKETKSQLSANGVSGGNKLSTERLFIYCG
jgi:DNA adenine methylase